MSSVFLDTTYVIALEASDDQHHGAAQQHWRPFLKQKPHLVTTTYVFDEIVTFFNSRGRHAKAVEIGRRLQESQQVEIVHVDAALFEAGWSYMRSRPDKRYSLTDCISFIVMEREGLASALTFDRHFEQAGFQCVPA